MSPLNIHPEETAPASKKKNNKNLKIFLGIGALIAIPVIGSTLAANITLSGSGGAAAVQFAQGSIETAQCDETLTVKGASVYVSGTFKLGKITISDIDLTSSGCAGKTLVASVDVSSNEADLITGTKQISITLPGTPVVDGNTNPAVTSGFSASLAVTSEVGELVIEFTTPSDSLISSADVDKFLIQSS